MMTLLELVRLKLFRTPRNAAPFEFEGLSMVMNLSL